MANLGLTTKCFISYHRPDNVDFTNVVDRLKAEVGGRFHAQTGRVLEIFVDRDAIGWGEDWRERIRSSVLEATFFVPVVTMRYFQSEACREELTTYHENARQLGVTELIMPIVLAGSSQISADHPDELVRLIDGLNYISIETAWAAGYESPEWLGVVNRMVDGLISALGRAEASLADREQSLEATPESPGEDEADIGALTIQLGEMTEDMQGSLAAMQTLGTVLTSVMENVNAQPSATLKQAALVRGSREISESGQAFADTSTAFERKARTTDAQLRAIIHELRDIDNDIARAQLATLTTPIANMPDLTGHMHSIDDAVSGLRVASMTNVSIRRALAPSLLALQSMRTALSTVRSWRAI